MKVTVLFVYQSDFYTNPGRLRKRLEKKQVI